MTWKDKIVDSVRNKRIFWRVVAGFSILLSLITGSAYILREILIEAVK